MAVWYKFAQCRNAEKAVESGDKIKRGSKKKKRGDENEA